jgi:SAM-dependent methyltransferase
MNPCAICGNETGNSIHTAHEMMFGLDGSFDYMECRACGCLRLLNVPADLHRYYPENYYSLSGKNSLAISMKCHWMSYSVFGKNPIGWFFSLIFGKHHLSSWMKESGMTLESAVLDLGCGGGNLLAMMKRVGFKNLHGADPFLEKNHTRDGVPLDKTEIVAIEGKFDIIMLHHSFEHMANPLAVLSKIKTLLNDGGKILLRIPIVDSYAWRTYGVNWLHLDAPRHLFLYTRKGIGLLAEKAGLRVASVRCDSQAAQFWGSEQYRMGIRHRGKNSFATNPLKSPFSPLEILKFRAQAQALNAKGEGDQACFILGK